MYCSNCGNQLPEGSKFCPSCGKECAPDSPGTPLPVFPKSAPTIKIKLGVALAALAALLCCCIIVLNFDHTGQEDFNDISNEIENNYFADARLNRQQARDNMLSALQDAVEQDEMMRNQLDNLIQTMADYTVTETQIENLIISKGYSDCVAYISDIGISLLVAAPAGELTQQDTEPAGGLTQEDTELIANLVYHVAGYTADQVTIIEVEG